MTEQTEQELAAFAEHVRTTGAVEPLDIVFDPRTRTFHYGPPGRWWVNTFKIKEPAA